LIAHNANLKIKKGDDKEMLGLLTPNSSFLLKLLDPLITSRINPNEKSILNDFWSLQVTSDIDLLVKKNWRLKINLDNY
jgi:hypothetical protein